MNVWVTCQNTREVKLTGAEIAQTQPASLKSSRAWATGHKSWKPGAHWSTLEHTA